MLSLRDFLNERLAAAAEEIFGAVERTIAEYRDEILRSKDLEISRLRLELKLLKSESESDECLEAELLQHTHQYHPPSPPPPSAEQQPHQSSPAVTASDPQHSEEEEEEEEDRDGEHPESSQVKQEQERTHRQYWMDHDGQQFEGLESDIKDFDSTPTNMKAGLHDQALHFHPFLSNSSGDETRDKPYSCSICEKRFSNCSHLAAHIRTHTGERPYKCEICSKTFITTSALNRHQTIHTEGKRHVCNYCGKSFKWMESLGRHLRSVHKKGDVPE